VDLLETSVNPTPFEAHFLFPPPTPATVTRGAREIPARPRAPPAAMPAGGGGGGGAGVGLVAVG
jgi:hypothetical protein